MKSRAFPRLLFLSAFTLLPLFFVMDTKFLMAEEIDDMSISCSKDAMTLADVLLSDGAPKEKTTCSFSTSVEKQCASIDPKSVFSQCNVFKLSINKLEPKTNGSNETYDTLLIKYSEGNDCKGGNDLLFLGRCDTFASYIQFLRNQSTGKCYAFVNSALLGTQLIEQSRRNSPNRIVRKVEIPGVSRRIIFVPSSTSEFKKLAGSEYLRLSNSRPGSYSKPGEAISPLFALELENTLTTKTDNLKPNPAKVRLTRGQGASSDFLDFSLNRKLETALNTILQGCS